MTWLRHSMGWLDAHHVRIFHEDVTTPEGLWAQVERVGDMTTTVTAIVPGFGGCAGGAVVTIIGTGLTDASAVRFGAKPAQSFSVSSDTKIIATVPAMDVGAVPPGSHVTVFVTVGDTEYAAQTPFIWVPTAPVIAWTFPTAAVTSIDPTSGSYPGGQSITITGTGFAGVVEVNFVYSGSAVFQASFTIDSDSQITATVPAIPAGFAYGYIFYVIVTTANGISASNPVANAFTYNPA